MVPRMAVVSSYHHGDLESALVEAAIALVRKYGPDHLSLRAVSADVGVSPSASYHYFQDKDALISAVGTILFDRLADLQEQAISKVSGNSMRSAKERFQAMGNAYFKWAVTEPNLYRLLFGGFCEMQEVPQDHKAWRLLSESLDELVSVGLISKSARQDGEVLVWSAVHGASSLIIEGFMPRQSFPEVLRGIQRSLGMK